jgi:hypothetical protein
VAFAVAALVIAGLAGAALTVNASVAVPVPVALVALSVTLDEPAAVGVQLVGLLLAVIW